MCVYRFVCVRVCARAFACLYVCVLYVHFHNSFILSLLLLFFSISLALLSFYPVVLVSYTVTTAFCLWPECVLFWLSAFMTHWAISSNVCTGMLHMHVHTLAHVRTHARMHTCMHACTHTHTHTHTYTHTQTPRLFSTCVCLYMCLCVCVYMCEGMLMHMCSRKKYNVYGCARTHTHMYAHALSLGSYLHILKCTLIHAYVHCRKKFMQLPAQGIQAKLAYLAPPVGQEVSTGPTCVNDFTSKLYRVFQLDGLSSWGRDLPDVLAYAWWCLFNLLVFVSLANEWENVCVCVCVCVCAHAWTPVCVCLCAPLCVCACVCACV